MRYLTLRSDASVEYSQKVRVGITSVRTTLPDGPTLRVSVVTEMSGEFNILPIAQK